VKELWVRALTGAVLVAVVSFSLIYSVYTSFALCSILAIVGVLELRRNKMGGLFASLLIVIACMSLFLIGFYPFFEFIPNGYYGLLPMSFIVAVWVNDTFAYLGGRLLGRKIIPRGLAPAISPNKSWEGAVIGVIGSFFMGYLMSDILDVGLFFALIAALATCGDLVQSAAKRRVGIKDAGSIFPGHGGVLDRFDSLLIAAPVILIIMLFNDFT
jgi:phosphatidate cytidylyltransferase